MVLRSIGYLAECLVGLAVHSHRFAGPSLSGRTFSALTSHHPPHENSREQFTQNLSPSLSGRRPPVDDDPSWVADHHPGWVHPTHERFLQALQVTNITGRPSEVSGGFGEAVSLEIDSISSSNVDRLQEGQLMAGWIYFFAALGMVALVVIAGGFLSWFVPVEKGPFRERYWRMPGWCVVMFVVLNVVSLAGGFPGWLIFGSLLVVVEVVMWIAYMLIRRAQMKKGRKIGPAPESGDDTAAADGNDGRPVDGGESGASTATSPPPALTTSQPGEMPVLVQGQAGADPSFSGNPGEFHVPRPRRRYSSFPERMGWIQKRTLVFAFIALLVILAVTMITFFAASLRFYVVWSRETGRPVDEVTPNMVVTKANMLLYAFPGVAKMFGMNLFNEWLTTACGNRFTKQLSESEKRTEILQNFIALYDIDMSIYEKESYLEYNTVNEWFSRPIKDGVRPISGSGNSSVVVSPADARVVLYDDVNEDLSIWLKGQRFTASRLLDSVDLAAPFEGGSIVIVRLAPQDYHRFHSPVDGNITAFRKASGPLHSVNAEGMRSESDAIFNKREIITIDTEHGKVAFVAIGAVCVGSIRFTRGVGDSVAKGDELGYFQFGGSTVVLMFEKGAVNYARDIVEASQMGVENLVVMGMGIGVFKS